MTDVEKEALVNFVEVLAELKKIDYFQWAGFNWQSGDSEFVLLSSFGEYPIPRTNMAAPQHMGLTVLCWIRDDLIAANVMQAPLNPTMVPANFMQTTNTWGQALQRGWGNYAPRGITWSEFDFRAEPDENLTMFSSWGPWEVRLFSSTTGMTRDEMYKALCPYGQDALFVGALGDVYWLIQVQDKKWYVAGSQHFWSALDMDDAYSFVYRIRGSRFWKSNKKRALWHQVTGSNVGDTYIGDVCEPERKTVTSPFFGPGFFILPQTDFRGTSFLQDRYGTIQAFEVHESNTQGRVADHRLHFFRVDINTVVEPVWEKVRACRP